MARVFKDLIVSTFLAYFPDLRLPDLLIFANLT